MTAAMNVEMLPSPFEARHEQVTVATPSCCCCCCCCLVTVTTATSFAAAEANLKAKQYGGNRILATILGLAAVPVAVVGLLSGLVGGNEEAAVLIPMGVAFLLLWAALTVAQAPQKVAVGVGAVVVFLTALGIVVELFAALMTALLLELLAPLGIWAGIAIARSRETPEFATGTFFATPPGMPQPPGPFSRTSGITPVPSPPPPPLPSTLPPESSLPPPPPPPGEGPGSDDPDDDPPSIP